MHSNTIRQLIQDNLRSILELRGSYAPKNDGSFVSKGDLLVQEIVFSYVSKQLPNHFLISEEFAPFDEAKWNPEGNYVFLDPIDGTENFVSGLKEWGVGLSLYTEGRHVESFIFLPEMGDFQCTGMKLARFRSRIVGISSSLRTNSIERLKIGGEFRITGCSMYNLLLAIRGSFREFTNFNNVWDVIPGLNLGLEHGRKVLVDGNRYAGELLFPTKKYDISVSAESDNAVN